MSGEGEVDRRQLLGWVAGASAVALLGCDGDASGGGAPDAAAPGACASIPDETAGPYPGDGTNGANALALAGIVRGDIRSSLGALSGTAEGVPLTLALRLVAAGTTCAPLAGYAVYVWHCDRDAQYSMYTLPAQNYLRGVQVTDADGRVSFTTIFPACYAGRWPHVHFEIFPDLAAAMAGGAAVAISQLAFPEDVCDEVYAQPGYAQSVTHLSRVSLASDGVFSDGATLQVAEMSGSVAAGLAAALQVAIAR